MAGLCVCVIIARPMDRSLPQRNTSLVWLSRLLKKTVSPPCTHLFCSSCGIRKEQQGAHTPTFTTNSILIPQIICQTILSMKCPRWFPGQETAIHFLFFKPLSSTYRKRKFSKNSMNSCSLLLLSLELGVQAAASCC